MSIKNIKSGWLEAMEEINFKLISSDHLMAEQLYKAFAEVDMYLEDATGEDNPNALYKEPWTSIEEYRRGYMAMVCSCFIYRIGSKEFDLDKVDSDAQKEYDQASVGNG